MRFAVRAVGGWMRLRSAITEPDVARRIRECFSLSSRAPPVALASVSDPRAVIERCESDPASADADRGFDFDQSPRDDPTPDDGS